MHRFYIAFHLLIFTMYACSMGSKRKTVFNERDPEKTLWVWCTKFKSESLRPEVVKNAAEYGCQRRCVEGKRNKLGKCKEYEILQRKWSHEKFAQGNWLVMPEG